jgi:hypothetical protein
MFWIRDRDGNLCNVARATDIRCVPPPTVSGQGWQVRADFQSHQVELFVGTPKECGRYIEELLRALKEKEKELAKALLDLAGYVAMLCDKSREDSKPHN